MSSTWNWSCTFCDPPWRGQESSELLAQRAVVMHARKHHPEEYIAGTGRCAPLTDPPRCPSGGKLTFLYEEEGSLAEGGTYEVYDCSEHGLVYVMLPD